MHALPTGVIFAQTKNMICSKILRARYHKMYNKNKHYSHLERVLLFFDVLLRYIKMIRITYMYKDVFI